MIFNQNYLVRDNSLYFDEYLFTFENSHSYFAIRKFIPQMFPILSGFHIQGIRTYYIIRGHYKPYQYHLPTNAYNIYNIYIMDYGNSKKLRQVSFTNINLNKGELMWLMKYSGAME